MKQLLICVETRKQADTDWVYIEAIIDEFFDVNNEVSIKPVYMGSKSKYNSNKVKKDIQQKIKEFDGKTSVLYCIDTDNYDSNIADKRMLKEITTYCKDNKYALAWFCKDIEEVLWHESVTKDDKVTKAAEFIRTKRIDMLKKSNLQISDIQRYCSNILSVLEKLLEN